VKLAASRASATGAVAEEGPVTKKSWNLDIRSLSTAEVDLSVKNPDGGEEITHRSPEKIMKEIAALDADSAEALENIKALL
jgi:type I restriction enzyme M protein